MSQPRGPSCRTEGMDHIVSKDSRERGRNGRPWFNVVFCDACGHVYGVFAKHVLGVRGGPQLVLEGRQP